MKPSYKVIASFLLLTLCYSSCLFASEVTEQPTEIEQLKRQFKSDLDDDQLPSVEWATNRLAQLRALNNDNGTRYYCCN